MYEYLSASAVLTLFTLSDPTISSLARLLRRDPEPSLLGQVSSARGGRASGRRAGPEGARCPVVLLAMVGAWAHLGLVAQVVQLQLGLLRLRCCVVGSCMVVWSSAMTGGLPMTPGAQASVPKVTPTDRLAQRTAVRSERPAVSVSPRLQDGWAWRVAVRVARRARSRHLNRARHTRRQNSNLRLPANRVPPDPQYDCARILDGAACRPNTSRSPKAPIFSHGLRTRWFIDGIVLHQILQ